jgi:hypothetical protein
MDPATVTGICIIIAVIGVVFWLPVIVFFPVIKSIADRISGKTAQSTQLTALQQKVQLIEHELTDIRTRQLSLEDSQKFQQQLTNPPKQS